MTIKTCFLFLVLGMAGCIPKSNAPTQDPRTNDLINSTWKMSSTDTVYLSGGAYSYISRSPSGPCTIGLHFEALQTFFQDTVCGSTKTATEQGTWFWALNDPLKFNLPSDSSKNNLRSFFRYTGDTLQLLFTYRQSADSLNGQPLRLVQTFIPAF